MGSKKGIRFLDPRVSVVRFRPIYSLCSHNQPQAESHDKPGGSATGRVRGGTLLTTIDTAELDMRGVSGWIGAKQEGHSVREYYSRLVGRRNYERVLGPMLSAVPSQSADNFPSDMLFKKRERRKDVMRSFTVAGGLKSIVEGLVRHPNIEVKTSCAAAGSRCGESSCRGLRFSARSA